MAKSKSAVPTLASAALTVDQQPTGFGSPTKQVYDELQRAYDHFNCALFSGQLPTCIITLQREKNTVGYFSPARFGNLIGAKADEIAMNPLFFAVVPLVETMQTLVHEMAHLWQHHFGTPGRGRYHNEEWAAKMERIGLMPSSNGQVDGKRTGDCMADYAIQGGCFLVACADLLTKDFRISWYDRFTTPEHVRAGVASMGMRLTAEVGGGSTPAQANEAVASMVRVATMDATDAASGQPPAHSTPNKSNRTKYGCDCGVSVWGKPGLLVICGACNGAFAEVT